MSIKRPRLRLIAVLLAAAAIFMVIAVQLVSQLDIANSDFFTFWLGGHMIALGQNPYATGEWLQGHHRFGATWIPNATFVYPLPLAMLFAPLGQLPLYQAYVVWVALTQSMIAVAVYCVLTLDPAKRNRHVLLPIIAGIALFRPTIITLVNGQVSGFLLLVAAVTVYLWQRDKWFYGGLVVPLLALKPNIGVPMLVLLALWLLRRRSWSALGGMAICGFALLAIGWAKNPSWVQEFLGIGNVKLTQTFGFSPTVWGISAYSCGYSLQCTISLGAIAATALLIGYIVVLVGQGQAAGPLPIMSLVILLTLLITPYTWPYDQILIVMPIVALLMHLSSKYGSPLINAALFLGIDICVLALLVLAAAVKLEIWNAFIPLAILVAVWLTLVKAPRLRL